MGSGWSLLFLMGFGWMLLFLVGLWMVTVISRWTLGSHCYFLMGFGWMLLFPDGPSWASSHANKVDKAHKVLHAKPNVFLRFCGKAQLKTCFFICWGWSANVDAWGRCTGMLHTSAIYLIADGHELPTRRGSQHCY